MPSIWDGMIHTPYRACLQNNTISRGKRNSLSQLPASNHKQDTSANNNCKYHLQEKSTIECTVNSPVQRVPLISQSLPPEPFRHLAETPPTSTVLLSQPQVLPRCCEDPTRSSSPSLLGGCLESPSIAQRNQSKTQQRGFFFTPTGPAALLQSYICSQHFAWVSEKAKGHRLDREV